MKTTSTPPNATQQSWDSSLKLLSAAKHGPYPPVVAGFDGFVDTILHAVSERRSASEYSRLTTLKAFSERILAASGRNLNIEMVPRLTKIGGNGPILAYALDHFDIPVSYIGCLGWPKLHPVFDDFAKKVETFSIAEPGHAAFQRNWLYVWALANSAESAVKGHVGVTYLPQGYGPDASHAATLGGWQPMVSAYSKNKDAAAKLVKYMVSFESQKQHAIELSSLPTQPGCV